MSTFKKKLRIFLKGLVVGASMLLPGVSGGTMAMLLVIYDDLISWVNSVTRLKFGKLPSLITFLAGGGLGMILFAKPLKALVDIYPQPMLFLFLGAVIGGVPLMYKKAEVKKFSWKVIVYPLLGAGIIILLSLLPADLLHVDLTSGISGYIILFLVGIFLAVAVVLPGISTSMMLLTLGIHTTTLDAIANLYLPFLIPLGLGVVAGILLTTNVLETLMKKFPQGCYLTILGFVIGSAFEIRPGVPTGINIPICLVLALAAFFAMYKLSQLEAKKEEEEKKTKSEYNAQKA